MSLSFRIMSAAVFAAALLFAGTGCAALVANDALEQQRKMNEQMQRQSAENEQKRDAQIADQFKRNGETFEATYALQRSTLKTLEAQVDGWIHRNGANKKLKGAPEFEQMMKATADAQTRLATIDTEHSSLVEWSNAVTAPKQEDLMKLSNEYSSLNNKLTLSRVALNNVTVQQSQIERTYR